MLNNLIRVGRLTIIKEESEKAAAHTAAALATDANLTDQKISKCWGSKVANSHTHYIRESELSESPSYDVIAKTATSETAKMR